jgi:anti-anti-sigma factor
MGDARFSIEAVDGSTAVIAPRGELDLGNVDELDASVEGARQDGRQRLLIDLSEVTHMDSTAMARLIAAHQSAVAGGGGVVLVAPAGAIRRTLEVRGLDGLFEVASSREEALQALAGEGRV